MENREYIRELIDKYLEGLTSPEEEKFLKEFFRKGDVPKEFRSEAQWFVHISDQSTTGREIQSLEESLSDWVDSREQHEKKHKIRLWYLGVAAGLALLAGTTFLFSYMRSGKIDDTYSDPQIAYMEARKVLLYVSETLNKGTDRLQTVSRIEEGSGAMSIFSTFGSGLKNLELFSKYGDESIEN